MQVMSNQDNYRYWTFKIPATLMKPFQMLPEQLLYETIVSAFDLLREEMFIFNGLMNTGSVYECLGYDSIYDVICSNLYELTYNYLLAETTKSLVHDERRENTQEELEELAEQVNNQLVMFMSEFIAYFKSLYLPFNQADAEPFKYSHANWLLNSCVCWLDIRTGTVFLAADTASNDID